MTVLVEGDLQITIADTLQARRFDGPAHGLSHCMKAVDFVIELPDRIMYVEFKDPDHPQARYESRQEFINDLAPIHRRDEGRGGLSGYESAPFLLG